MSRDRKNNTTVRTNTGKMLFKAKFWIRKSQGHPRIFKVGSKVKLFTGYKCVLDDREVLFLLKKLRWFGKT